jgi:hypothetical protein
MRKKDEETMEGPATLLQELCGGDAELYECLSVHVYETPLRAMSPKDLDALTAEAEDSGGLRRALDKAVYESSQHPEEREKYIQAIQDLASNIMSALEQEQAAAEKKGLTSLAQSLGRESERQKILHNRTSDVLDVASKFYAEKKLEREEDERREARRKARKRAEREDRNILKAEKADRRTRKSERRDMTRSQRREAKRQEKREAQEAEERTEARRHQKQEAEQEDQRIAERESEAREARREERHGDPS